MSSREPFAPHFGHLYVSLMSISCYLRKLANATSSLLAYERALIDGPHAACSTDRIGNHSDDKEGLGPVEPGRQKER